MQFQLGGALMSFRNVPSEGSKSGSGPDLVVSVVVRMAERRCLLWRCGFKCHRQMLSFSSCYFIVVVAGGYPMHFQSAHEQCTKFLEGSLSGLPLSDANLSSMRVHVTPLVFPIEF